MTTIHVTVCGAPQELPEGATLAEAIGTFSPYGEEAVICRLNGQMVRSIDDTAAYVLRYGDVLEIYPLIIGG